MVYQVTIPVLDQTTESVTLASWRVQPGAAVNQGDIICEIETEKATVEIEAPGEGILRKVFVDKGAEIPPRTIVALIANADETLPEIDPFQNTPRARSTSPTPSATNTPADPAAPTRAASAPTKIIASPRAKKLAAEHGIDLVTVTPTGPDGRILEEDVTRAIQSKVQPQGDGVGAERIARARAERVSRSWQTIPHFYMTMTADLTPLVNAKAQAAPDVTYTDYILAALGRALAKHPHLNGYWKDDAAEPIAEVRIGIVVQTERGLLIPALNDVRGRSVAEIAAERAKLVALAREGKQSGDAGAPTFTLSNVGAGHIDSFTAIISPPQLAILSVGSILPRPVVVGSNIEVRPTASFTLGVDHRALDGRDAAAFLEELKQQLEGAV